MATQATGSTAAGTITLVVGNVRVIGVDGVARAAKVGDKVFAREVIETGADGIIQVQLDGGRFLDVGRDSKLALSNEILAEASAGTPAPAVPPAATPAGAEQDAAALQKAIAAGADPSQVAAATAAGGAPAAGGAGADGGGGTPVLISQSDTTGEVTSGFPTQPASIDFPDIEPQLLPEEGEPVVSVIVRPQPDEGVEVSGNAASVIEGTQDTAGGTSDTKIVNFVITLSEAFDTDVQVTYVIQPGSALTPEDFLGELTGTITIPAGETEFIVPVEIVMDHFVEGDQTFNIVLTDAVNATIDPASDTAVVTIFNDDTAPDANPDTNWTQEDSLVNPTASGNVLENQPHAGAPSGSFTDRRDVDVDGQEVLTVTRVNGQALGGDGEIEVAGQYGTLVLHSDGSYTYTLNNGLGAIQRLDDGETLSEDFGYTITDGYNDPSSSTLTITIFGTNDVPRITVKTDGDIFAEAADATVDEEGLATGSNAASNKEFTSGSFRIRDTDGADDLESVTINGQTIALGDLVGATIDGEHGVMTIMSFDGEVATFTYELTERTEDAAGPETDVFVLTTTDGTSTSDPATVTISIIDDVPTARDDSNSMTEDDVSVSGNVRDEGPGTDTRGADRPATVTGGTFEGEFGTLTLNADGSYTYTLTANLDHLDTEDPPVVEQFPYTLTDADGDTSNAVLTITITGTNDGPVARADTNWVEEDHEVNSTATGNVLETIDHDRGQLQFGDVADTDVDIEDLTVTSVDGQALGGDGEIEIDGQYGTLVLHSDGTYTYTLDNQNDDVQLLGEGDTLTDSFNYTASDGTASAGSTLTITIFGTNDGPRVGSDATRVSEEGLEGAIPDETGNTDTTDSETASGQIAVSDSDGDTVTVTLSEPSESLESGGQTIDWSLSGDGKTLTGTINEGSTTIVTVTINDSGEYTVTLSGPIDHSDPTSEDNESFTVGVNASDGSTTNSGSLVVTIEDDSPTVNVTKGADTGVVLTTQDAETDGDPTDNDTASSTANFSGVFAIGSSAFGADGAGTAPVLGYTLNLVGAEGSDSGLDSNGVQINLFKLADGTIVGATGNVEPASATAASVVFSISVNGSGVVTLTQRQEIDHALEGTTTAPFDDQFAVLGSGLVTLTAAATITDGDGDTASDSETVDLGGNIRFADDGPVITPQNMSLANEEGNSATASLNLALGADGGAVAITGETNGDGEALDADGNVMTSGGEPLTYITVGDVLYATTDGTVGGAVFSVNPDPATGTYTVTMIGTLDAQTITFTSDFSQTDAGGPADPYTSNFIGPNGETQVVEIFGFGEDEANPSTDGLGVDGNTVGDGERVGTYFGINVDNVTLSLGNFSTAGQDAQFQWSAWAVDTAAFAEADTPEEKQTFYDSVTIVGNNMFATVNGVPLTLVGTKVGSTQTVTADDNDESDVDIIELDPAGEFNFIYIEGTNGSFKISGVSFETTLGTDPVIANFTATATDGDGDTATSDLVVNFSGTNTTGGFEVTGTDGDDVLNGGTGDDILTGGLGTDTFQWGAGEGDATPPVDTVTDFNQAPGDKLDISELLVGESHTGNDAGNLANFLSFSYDSGTNSTIVNVKSTGAAVDQQIVLSGVGDLTAGGANDATEIIQTLLTQGKLIAD